MKTFITLFSIILTLGFQANSQTQPKSERFRSSEETIQVEEKTSFNFQYLLDEFSDGEIYYDNGSVIEAKMNYNILLNAIQFYDSDGNLQSLSYDPSLDSIAMGDHMIKPFEKFGFMEVFHDDESPLLLHRNIRVFSETLVQGAYGSTDRTAKTERVTAIAGIADAGRGIGFNNDFLVPNREGDLIEVSMTFHQTFYFPYGDEYIELSNRRAVIRAFPDYQKELNGFFKENKIDFDSPDSLKSLTAFLQSLK